MLKKQLDSILAWSTVILTVLNGALVIATFQTLRETKEASLRQIGVQTWLDMEKRFDSIEMIAARKKFARQVRHYDPLKYNEMSDIVPNFFEDIGTLYRVGYIDKELADSSFGFYVCPYWEASKPYVTQQRNRYGSDATIYEEFQQLAKSMRTPDDKLDAESVTRFLDDEIDLSTN